MAVPSFVTAPPRCRWPCASTGTPPPAIRLSRRSAPCPSWSTSRAQPRTSPQTDAGRRRALLRRLTRPHRSIRSSTPLLPPQDDRRASLRSAQGVVRQPPRQPARRGTPPAPRVLITLVLQAGQAVRSGPRRPSACQRRWMRANAERNGGMNRLVTPTPTPMLVLDRSSSAGTTSPPIRRRGASPQSWHRPRGNVDGRRSTDARALPVRAKPASVPRVRRADPTR
jgi:hypothetical protein